MWSEWFAYELQSIFGGWLGAQQLAMVTTINNYILLPYLVGIGMSNSVSSLVGSAVGKMDVRKAKSTIFVAVAIDSVVYA